MKKWYTFTSKINLLLLASLILSFSSYGKGPIARVKRLNGNVFILKDGQVKQARIGTAIDDFSEIITEERSNVTLVDYYDHYFHLTSSSHLKIRNRSVELVGGYLWIQTIFDREGFSIQTANSFIKYGKGEAIVSFDPVKEKTQIVSVRGNYTFSNIHDKFAYTTITDGNFSFIEKSFNREVPRKSTSIGYKSFLKLRSLFVFVKPIEQRGGIIAFKSQQYFNSNRKRSIASIKRENNAFENGLKKRRQDHQNHHQNQDQFHNYKNRNSHSKVLVLRDQSTTAKMNRARHLKSLYQRKIESFTKPPVKKKFKISYKGKKSNFKIRIFKSSSRRPASIKKKKMIKKFHIATAIKKRGPASVILNKPMAKQIKRSGKSSTNLFESNLIRQYKNQRRHSDEVNSLIDELESVKIDNKKHY